ncbi:MULTISPECIES: hypothetical protein [unclassified Moorena]|uniref:Uncharacterized protein n=1 Tax=Moorena producens 3L TaxID=489825 RepID=F4XPM7_9CYAN|nr:MULTISPECIES: hypothetical protein [unclassified Moorena]EGJ33481.1 hypothetical protein LYNGBM3L_34470 [Moorena producens 3L]NEP30583.1 hypothetical protein [Moorena sp. SIO3B2]
MAIDQTPVEWKKPTSHVEENEAGIELQTECLGLCKIHDAVKQRSPGEPLL